MKLFKYILFVCFFLIVTSVVSGAAEKSFLVGEGTYFTVYGFKGMDKNILLDKLGYGFTSSYMEEVMMQAEGSDEPVVGSLDALYLEISDILDLHSYNFHGTIKVVATQKEIAQIFKKQYGRDFSERSFFVHEENTIYISLEDITLGMVGHEIAHAVISHYFVIPPPQKMAEVLSGYVEFHLRKAYVRDLAK